MTAKLEPKKRLALIVKAVSTPPFFESEESYQIAAEVIYSLLGDLGINEERLIGN